MPPANHAIAIDDLRKTYADGTPALGGVELTIKRGEFFGLLGPNGAGKSTLIHAITGLVVPSGGSITIFGKDALGDYQHARQFVGLSPQDINLDWFLSVEETLDYHGGYFGMPRDVRRARIEELLKAFSLAEKRRANIRGLSGGMKRRLVIARALMHQPELLILDEPTAGVDVELRLDLWEYMQQINKTGTTILLTTHYIEEAEQLCSRIGLINQGKIVQTGTAAELKKEYDVKTLQDVYLKVTGRDQRLVQESLG